MRFGVSLLLLLISFSACELILRLFTQPSESSYGRLFGSELPPQKLVMKADFDAGLGYQVWHKHGKPNPDHLTNGDLWGIFREDKDLGFVNAENAHSTRGWWQSNNIGASTTEPTTPKIPRGRQRIFIFGESFGRGSRVRMSEAWSSLIQTRNPRLQVINMAVDGYSMGQAYKRFQMIRAQYDFDQVVFMLVPDFDTWRDVNTMRYLGEGWSAYTILPRFRLEGAHLAWVPAPYAIGSDIYKNDLPEVTPKIREHLRKYDAFYFPLLHDDAKYVGNSILYKMTARLLGEMARQRLRISLRDDIKSEGAEFQ